MTLGTERGLLGPLHIRKPRPPTQRPPRHGATREPLEGRTGTSEGTGSRGAPPCFGEKAEASGGAGLQARPLLGSPRRHPAAVRGSQGHGRGRPALWGTCWRPLASGRLHHPPRVAIKTETGGVLEGEGERPADGGAETKGSGTGRARTGAERGLGSRATPVPPEGAGGGVSAGNLRPAVLTLVLERGADPHCPPAPAPGRGPRSALVSAFAVLLAPPASCSRPRGCPTPS